MEPQEYHWYWMEDVYRPGQPRSEEEFTASWRDAACKGRKFRTYMMDILRAEIRAEEEGLANEKTERQYRESHTPGDLSPGD